MTYLGPWQDDALPTDWLVDVLDSDTPGSGATAFTFGWSSQSTDGAAASGVKMRQAWDGTGPIMIPVPGTRLADLQTAEDFFGPRAFYESLWLTVNRRLFTLNFGTLSPERAAEIDSTPGVVGLEWEPTDVRIEERVILRAYNGQAHLVGRTVPVKFVDAVPLPHWEPPFEPVGAMNARPNLTTIPLAADGSLAAGEVTVEVPVSGASAFALSVVDPRSAEQDISGLTPPEGSSVFLKVTYFATFEPQRYRLIYAAPPVRTLAPPARLSGRTDGLGPLGGAHRLDTKPTSRQAGFRPGSYY